MYLIQKIYYNKKVTELFYNQEKMVAMSKASYKKAKQFHAEVVARKWQDIFETIFYRRNVKVMNNASK
jgi:hypothetical protein